MNRGQLQQLRMEKRKKRKPMEKNMTRYKSKDSRGGVPSAPCREREHGRETLWIIIAQKSRKNKLPADTTPLPLRFSDQ